MESKVIVIVGPTCSGKTDLSLRLAEKLNSEIISADSRQIYKFLNIGTAKPTETELGRVNHHLIDFLYPNEEYNASMFENDSIEIITDLLKKGKIPIVVGGSGLYIRALVDGIFNTVNTDEDFRTQIMSDRIKFGNEYIYGLLKQKDPKTAENLLPQNWKRIIRALEVFHITGEPIWKHQQEYQRNLPFSFIQFGLNWDRKILYKNIEARVDKMIDAGLVDEVKLILEMGIDKNINALNTVGYKEIINYLDENIKLTRAEELIKRNTRRYAKRQLTWFRRDERIKWFDISESGDLINISEDIFHMLQ